MTYLNLSWTVATRFPPYGGNVDNPNLMTIAEKLLASLHSSGTVTLEMEDENERSKSLQVRAENGMYFLSLGIETETDWIVRTYRNPDVKPPGDMLDILGDRWNTQAICRDSEIVMAVFEEFFKTGDVSRKYLI